MKCPDCGLVFYPFWNPIRWENHKMLHDIIGLLLVINEREEVNE